MQHAKANAPFRSRASDRERSRRILLQSQIVAAASPRACAANSGVGGVRVSDIHSGRIESRNTRCHGSPPVRCRSKGITGVESTPTSVHGTAPVETISNVRKPGSVTPHGYPPCWELGFGLVPHFAASQTSAETKPMQAPKQPRTGAIGNNISRAPIAPFPQRGVFGGRVAAYWASA